MSAPLPSVPNTPEMFDDKGQMVPTWRGFFDTWRSVLNPIYDAVQAHSGSISDLDSLLGSVKPMPGGDIVGTTDVQTVTNKTIQDSTIDASNAIDLGEGITVVNPDVRWNYASHTYTASPETWTLSDTESSALLLLIPIALAGAKIVAPYEEGRVYIVTNNGANDVWFWTTAAQTAHVVVTAGTSIIIYHNATAYAAATGTF